MKTTLRTKKLPRGFGSIQKRRRTYWMIFTNAAGKKVQENSGSARRDVAQFMLAERALETANAKVAMLQAYLDEAAEAAYEALQREAGTEAASKVGIGRRSRAIGRLVRGNDSVVRTGAKGKGGSR
jgi:hypothetical protein